MLRLQNYTTSDFHGTTSHLTKGRLPRHARMHKLTTHGQAMRHKRAGQIESKLD